LTTLHTEVIVPVLLLGSVRTENMLLDILNDPPRCNEVVETSYVLPRNCSIAPCCLPV
jgi:hypothetical protein